MPPVAVDEERWSAFALQDGDRAARSRFMLDQVRHAPARNFDAGPNLGTLRNFRKPLFEPALMAVEKAVDFTLRNAGRNGDPQAASAGVYAQRQPPRPVVLDDPQRQSATGNVVHPFPNRSRGLWQGAFEKSGKHGPRRY